MRDEQIAESVAHDDLCERNDGPLWCTDWPCECEERERERLISMLAITRRFLRHNDGLGRSG